jgi:hypothetical protein
MSDRGFRVPGGRALFVVCIALLVVTSTSSAAFAAVPGATAAGPAVTSDAVGTVDTSGASAEPAEESTATIETGSTVDTAAIDAGSTLDAAPIDADVTADALAAPQIGFGVGGLAGTSQTNPTSLQFGPDGRLYVAVQSGEIYAYTIDRNGANDYVVTDTEVITAILDLPNHDDDGTPNPSVTERLITGIYVTGTAANPVLYVSSSDPRIGGGDSGTDTNLDTNSGIVSRLIWNGAGWDHFQVVRGGLKLIERPLLIPWGDVCGEVKPDVG